MKVNENCTILKIYKFFKGIIKKYSNFVGFKINLNGKQINTIKALWTMNKNDISEKDHTEFYQFICKYFFL